MYKESVITYSNRNISQSTHASVVVVSGSSSFMVKSARCQVLLALPFRNVYFCVSVTCEYVLPAAADVMRASSPYCSSVVGQAGWFCAMILLLVLVVQ